MASLTYGYHESRIITSQSIMMENLSNQNCRLLIMMVLALRRCNYFNYKSTRPYLNFTYKTSPIIKQSLLDWGCFFTDAYHIFTLIPTIIVLNLIKMASTAGLNTTPIGATRKYPF